MSKLEELGLTRNKAILIGILGTVFIGVLVTNLMPCLLYTSDAADE